MPTYQVHLTFTEPLLGSAPLDRKTYETYILPKMPLSPPDEADERAAEELDTIAHSNGNGMDSKGITGFHRTEDGKPFLYSYVIQGYFKDACGMLRRIPGKESAALKAYKTIIDGMVFPMGLLKNEPRKIVLNPPDADGEIVIFARSLRAETAQGPRVAIATSERMPAGTTCEFTIDSLGVVTESLLREWFDYGIRRGIGCWRNGSWGRFKYTLTRS